MPSADRANRNPRETKKRLEEKAKAQTGGANKRKTEEKARRA